MVKQILRRTFIFYVKKTRIREIFKSNSILFYTLRYVANTNQIPFPMQSPSFLRLTCMEDDKCLICSQNLDEERKPYNFGEKGWRRLKLQATNWQKISIPERNDYYHCTKVYEKIKDFGNAFGQAYRACKKIFDLQYTKIKHRYGEKETLEQQGKFLF